MRQLPRELSRSQRYGHALALLNCDIDGFKQFNDGLGHQVGDTLLRAFVERAEGCIRKDSDWVARVAGDEFMLVLPETHVHGAHCVAQKLREVFASKPVSTSAGPVNFTVCVGITAMQAVPERGDMPRADALLRAAGRGLHASKTRGVDRVTAAAVSTDITIAVGSPTGNDHGIH